MSDELALTQDSSSADAPEDTIAAIATPLGEGGLGVVRLSGPAAFDIASRLFRSTRPLKESPSHTLHHGHVVDGEIPVDEAVAAVFRAPRSYTGENVLEISCHGGIFILKRVLALCLARGARPADPGEFTRRAFLNGKMDLAQAEAVGDLIAAQSDTLRRLALDQLQGRLSRHLHGPRRRLLETLAHLEADLDFVEDEVPNFSPEKLNQHIQPLLEDLRALLKTASQGRLFREGLRVVLVGKPNVGKSSLFNALLNTDRAIVTEIPGTTRDTLEERLLIGEIPVTLTDTAGLRNVADPVETEGIARARRALDRADVAVFVTDASEEPTREDIEVARFMEGKKVVLALNKCDRLASEKLPEGRFTALSNVLPPAGRRVLTSAATGRGMDDLRRAITGEEGPRSETAPVPTIINVRHEALLKESIDALETASGGAKEKIAAECLAVDLRRALDRLNQITGEGVHDEILNAIFAKFCIGK